MKADLMVEEPDWKRTGDGVFITRELAIGLVEKYLVYLKGKDEKYWGNLVELSYTIKGVSGTVIERIKQLEQ